MTVEAKPTSQAPPQLSGRLDSFPSFEILQVFSDLRKWGELRMQNEDGRIARCIVASGVVFEPSCGHLVGVEALVAMSWWNRGTFELLPIDDALPAGHPLRLPEVLMDGVRIADEIERRRDHLPERDVPLTLIPSASPPEDSLSCELLALFSHLEKNPRSTLTELESNLPFAPTKIRLGVALLCEAGLVKKTSQQSEETIDSSKIEADKLDFEELELDLRTALEDVSALLPPVAPNEDDAWWRRILSRYPGGLRALIVCPSGGSPDDVFSAVSRIAGSLRMPNHTVSYAPDGPSFVRIRPRGGGILSFTFLPLSRKHRYLFLAFVKSVEAVFLCPDNAARSELETWEERIPKTVKVIRLAGNRAIDEEIARYLPQMEDVPS